MRVEGKGKNSDLDDNYILDDVNSSDDIWYAEMKEIAYSVQKILKQQLEIATQNQIILNKILEAQKTLVQIPDVTDEPYSRDLTKLNELIQDSINQTSENNVTKEESAEISKFPSLERSIKVGKIVSKLYSMKKSAKEKTSDFIDRFENLTNEFDRYDSTGMSDAEKANLFYNSVVNTISPKFKTACTIGKDVTGTQMKYDKMKEYLLDLESEIYSGKQSPTANSPKTTSLTEIKCHRCNKKGHWSVSCPLADLGMYFCYGCNGYNDHKSDQCPKITQRTASGSNSNNTPNCMLNSRGKGRGKIIVRRPNRHFPYQVRHNP